MEYNLQDHIEQAMAIIYKMEYLRTRQKAESVLPTPTANDAKNNASPSAMNRKTLALNAVVALPTPCASDATNQRDSRKRFNNPDSKEYNEKTLKALIEKKDKWTFLFLGANQDSYATAQRYGIHVSNAVNFAASSTGVTTAINTLSFVTNTASRAVGTSGFYAQAKNVTVNIA